MKCAELCGPVVSIKPRSKGSAHLISGIWMDVFECLSCRLGFFRCRLTSCWPAVSPPASLRLPRSLIFVQKRRSTVYPKFHEMRFWIFNQVVRVLQLFAVNQEALVTLKKQMVHLQNPCWNKLGGTREYSRRRLFHHMSVGSIVWCVVLLCWFFWFLMEFSSNMCSITRILS
jgi:hypothetical protein